MKRTAVKYPAGGTYRGTGVFGNRLQGSSAVEQVYDFGSRTVRAAPVTSSEGAVLGEAFTTLIADVPSSAVEDFRFPAENFQIAQALEPVIVDAMGCMFRRLDINRINDMFSRLCFDFSSCCEV